MSKAVSKYRIYCTTEQGYTYTWSDVLPTTCPNNNQHSIDSATITIIDTVSTNAVQIIQESTPTGGHYRAESKKITVSANSTQYFDYSWPYQLSVLTVKMYTSPENENDIVNSFIAPYTVIGVLTDSAAEDDTILHVNSTVTDNIQKGYRVYLFNGVTSTPVGECITIDKVAGTITLDTQLAGPHVSGTYVQMSINNITDFVLKGNTVYSLAEKTIGGSSIPANTVVRVEYTNNGNEATDFFFAFEYLY